MSWMCWQTSSPSSPSLIIICILLQQQREPEAPHPAKVKAPRALGVLKLICPGKTPFGFFCLFFWLRLEMFPPRQLRLQSRLLAHRCSACGTHLTVHSTRQHGSGDVSRLKSSRIFSNVSQSDLFSGVGGMRLK